MINRHQPPALHKPPPKGPCNTARPSNRLSSTGCSLQKAGSRCANDVLRGMWLMAESVGGGGLQSLRVGARHDDGKRTPRPSHPLSPFPSNSRPRQRPPNPPTPLRPSENPLRVAGFAWASTFASAPVPFRPEPARLRVLHRGGGGGHAVGPRTASPVLFQCIIGILFFEYEK